jgi:hypothetical protein
MLRIEKIYVQQLGKRWFAWALGLPWQFTAYGCAHDRLVAVGKLVDAIVTLNGFELAPSVVIETRGPIHLKKSADQCSATKAPRRRRWGKKK